MARLDVREDLRQGLEPLGKILATVRALAPGESLEVIAPFEPLPLYALMENRGFRHQTEAAHDGSWRIVFTPDPTAPDD